MPQAVAQGMNSEDLDRLLSTSSEEGQIKILKSLPPEQLTAYSLYEQAKYGATPPTKPFATLPSGARLVHRPALRPTPQELKTATPEDLALLPQEQQDRALSLETGSAEAKPTGRLLDNTFGLTARAALKSGLALPGLAADYTVLPIIDKMFEVPGQEGQGRVSELGFQGLIDSIADQAGMKIPTTPGERIFSDVVGGIASVPSGGVIGKGLSLLKSESGTLAGATTRGLAKLGEAMMKNPKTQMLSAALGGGAAGATRESGGGTAEQIMASLLAGSVPYGGIMAGGAAIRKALVKDPALLADNIATYKAAGTTPNVGQATGSAKTKEVQSFLSKLFGTSGTMQRDSQRQVNDITGNIDRLAQTLSKRSNPTGVGYEIADRVENHFIPNQKDLMAARRLELANALPPSTPSSVGNFYEFVTRKASSHPKISIIGNDKIMSPAKQDWGATKRSLDSQLKANGGTIPFEGIQELRTGIGEQLSDTFISPLQSASMKDLKGAYAALSADLLAAAPNQNAKNQLMSAISRDKEFFDHLDLIKPVVDKHGGGENIFKAAVSNTKIGATQLRAVYDSIPKDTQKSLSAAIIRQMGKKQDEVDLSTFLRNYGGMSKEAREQVFGRMGPEFEKNFQKIFEASTNMAKDKLRYGIASSPSEGGRLGMQWSIYPILAILSGGVQAGATGASSLLASGLTGAAGAAVGLMGAKSLAKWLINPKAVEFLAASTTIPPSALPAALNQLGQQGRRSHDPDLIELSEYLKSKTEGQ